MAPFVLYILRNRADAQGCMHADTMAPNKLQLRVRARLAGVGRGSPGSQSERRCTSSGTSTAKGTNLGLEDLGSVGCVVCFTIYPLCLLQYSWR